MSIIQIRRQSRIFVAARFFHLALLTFQITEVTSLHFYLIGHGGIVHATAHQLHGAIGATAAHDLQLWTGALTEARLADGSESHWAVVLGRHRLDDCPADGASYVRTYLQPGEMP